MVSAMESVGRPGNDIEHDLPQAQDHVFPVGLSASYTLIVAIMGGPRLMRKATTATRTALGVVMGCLLLGACSSADDLWHQNPLDSPDFGIPVGSLDDCRLETFPSGDSLQNLAWPVHPDLAPSTGTLLVRVIFVDFPDSPGSVEPDVLIDFITEGVGEFYEDVSYGALEVQFGYHHEWITMERDSSTYSWEGLGWDSFVAKAIEAADPDLNFANTEVLIIVVPPEIDRFDRGIEMSTSDSSGWKADNDRINNVITVGQVMTEEGRRIIIHEIGHALGLPDLYETGEYETSRFTGEFGVMGDDYGQAPEFFAYERWLLGWLGDDRVRCIDGEYKAALSAIETGDGLAAIMVRTGPSRLLVVESRRPIGHDSELRTPGVVVYQVDTSIHSGKGPIQVVPADEFSLAGVVLEPGEYLKTDGIEIKVFEANETTDIIGIRVLVPREERVP